MPTLKILSGGSIANLLREALGKIEPATHPKEPQNAPPAAIAFEPSKPAFLDSIGHNIANHLSKMNTPSYGQSSPNSSPSPLFTPADGSGAQSDDEPMSPPIGDDLGPINKVVPRVE